MNGEINISENLLQVRRRIAAACERAGRAPEEVTLVAVSKRKPFSDIEAARAAGAADFGENYVQELTEKMSLLEAAGETGTLRWHMIGHLQKNKVRYLAGRVALIHSVDSLSLSEQLEKEGARQNCLFRILLEVNVAREESKWGFDAAGAAEAAEKILSLPHLRVLGLMTSAPWTENPESNRPYFRELRELSRELARRELLTVSDPEFPGPVLSMGMTGDYEVAVEEGATLVRVGTGIFGERS